MAEKLMDCTAIETFYLFSYYLKPLLHGHQLTVHSAKKLQDLSTCKAKKQHPSIITSGSMAEMVNNTSKREKNHPEAAQCGMGSQPYATHLSGDACFVVLTSVKEIIQRAISAVQQLILSTEVLTNCLEFFNLLNADGFLLPDGHLVNMALNPYKGRVTATCKEVLFNNKNKKFPKHGHKNVFLKHCINSTTNTSTSRQAFQ